VVINAAPSLLQDTAAVTNIAAPPNLKNPAEKSDMAAEAAPTLPKGNRLKKVTPKA
jgi:hypothetical protein